MRGTNWTPVTSSWATNLQLGEKVVLLWRLFTVLLSRPSRSCWSDCIWGSYEHHAALRAGQCLTRYERAFPAHFRVVLAEKCITRELWRSVRASLSLSHMRARKHARSRAHTLRRRHFFKQSQKYDPAEITSVWLKTLAPHFRKKKKRLSINWAYKRDVNYSSVKWPIKLLIVFSFQISKW